MTEKFIKKTADGYTIKEVIDADPPIFVVYSPRGVALKPTQPSEDAAVRQAEEDKKQAVEAENADDDKVEKKTKASPLRPKK